MKQSFAELTHDISAHLKDLRHHIPDTMQGFSAMAQSAKKTGALDEKTKELIALALGVAAHCNGCIGFHTRALARLGASTDEIAEALGMAIYMGGGPSLMYAAEAMQAWKEFSGAPD